METATIALLNAAKHAARLLGVTSEAQLAGSEAAYRRLVETIRALDPEWPLVEKGRK